ncbi:MAG: methyl-accepting chemotaxis protein [Candidatus Thermoplasmatota archaeon]|nr:methyl-accepting chemotaxis protein [Candidatus Thermoplasmatota archaeon]
MASIVVVALMVAVAVVGIFASVPGVAGATPAPPAAASQLTLTPGTVSSDVATALTVTSSSVTFAAGAPLYYETAATPTWSGTGAAWFSLPAGVTAIPAGTFTPAFTETSAFYFLVSASSSGSAGVYTSQAISVEAAGVTPSLSATPSSGLTVGQTVKVTGSGYAAGASVAIYFASSVTSPATLPSPITTVTASSSSDIKASITVPNAPAGTDYILALATSSSGTTWGYTFASSVPTDAYFAVSVGPTFTVPTASVLAETASIPISGTGFAANSAITISDNEINASGALVTTPSPLVTDSTGSFSGTVSIYLATYSEPYGATTLTATDASHNAATGTLTITKPHISVSPSSIIPTQSFTVSGTGFGIGLAIAANSVTIGSESGSTSSAQTVSSSGTFSFTVATSTMTTWPAFGPEAVALTATMTGISQGASTSLKLLKPNVTLSSYALGPGLSYTFSGLDFYPGSTVATNSITIASATITNAGVTVPSSGSFSGASLMATPTSGALTSGRGQTLTVIDALPPSVTIDGSTTVTVIATVDVLTPTVVVSYPSGLSSLTAGASGSVALSNFYPGATILADSITIGGTAVTNAATTIGPAGSATIAFTVPTTFTTSGVFSLVVTETVSGLVSGASLSPDSASQNVILSSPTITSLTIEVASSASGAPSSTLSSADVGSTVYVYLFGYPASASGLSLSMGPDVVLSGISVDANGAFAGTFMVPALPGTTAGLSYTVQTSSAQGYAAQSPATVSVVPSLVFSGTEAYYLADSYLATGDTVTVSGTGFDASASVTFSGSAPSPPTSVTTDVTGSFAAVYTVPSGLSANSPYTLGAATSTATVSAMTLFYYYATPTLSVSPTIGTGGTSLSFAATGYVTVSGTTYSVTGAFLTSPVSIVSGSGSGTIASTAASGVYTATLTGSAPFDTLTATATVLVSTATSSPVAGVLLNASNGHSVSTIAGGTFSVYAADFATESSSTITLASTGASGTFVFTTTATDSTDGAGIFGVTASSTALPGTYLIYATQSSSSYTTSAADSLTVVIGPTITFSSTVASGGTIHVTTAGAGFTPNAPFSVYFGDGVHAGTNIGTLTSSSTGAIADTQTLTAPVANAGSYEIGVAPYTAAATIPASAVFPSTFGAITVTNNVVWTPDPSAFPGQLVSFVYTLTAPLSPAPIAGTTQMLVTLNGTDYAQVPVTYDSAAATLSGSFTMFNGAPGSTYTLAIQPVYQTGVSLTSNDTQTVAFTAATTTLVPETFSWSIPAGSGTIVSESGYLTDTTTGTVAGLASGDFSFTQPTGSTAGSVTLEVPTSAQTLTDSYTATVTIELKSASAIPTTVTGTASGSTPLTLASGSGALVLSISHSDIAEIATLSGAFVNITLAQLNATINKIYSLDGHMYASLISGFGNMTVSLSAINATVTSVSDGIVSIQTTLGAISTSIVDLNATVAGVAHGLVELSSAVGNLTVSLADLNATVATVANGVLTLTTDVGQISVALADLNATVASIHGTMLTLITDMGEVQGTVASLNVTVTAVGVTTAQIAANVNSLLGATADINTSVGIIQGKVIEISGSVAQVSTSLGTLTMNVSKLQGTANTIQSQTSSTPNVTTYLIIVIVLAIIAIVVGLFAVMRVNAVARRLEGHSSSTRPGQQPPSGGAGESQEPPK